MEKQNYDKEDLIKFLEDIIEAYEIKEKEKFIANFFHFAKSLDGTIDLDEKSNEFSKLIIAYSTINLDKVHENAEEELKGLING